MTSVTLAVEDTLSQTVFRKIIQETRRDIAISSCLGLRGNGYLRDRARDLNRAAQGSAFWLLTDQDVPARCPVTIRNEWLAGDAPHPNFLFRVAVMEVEAWLLADRTALAQFLSVPIARVPLNPDALPDPKQFLVNLARSSSSSAMREDLVPKQGGTAKVGRGYNHVLGLFVTTHWSQQRARDCSDSLSRTIRRIRDFRAQ